jgi:hypothetical protein
MDKKGRRRGGITIQIESNSATNWSQSSVGSEPFNTLRSQRTVGIGRPVGEPVPTKTGLTAVDLTLEGRIRGKIKDLADIQIPGGV